MDCRVSSRNALIKPAMRRDVNATCGTTFQQPSKDDLVSGADLDRFDSIDQEECNRPAGDQRIGFEFGQVGKIGGAGMHHLGGREGIRPE